MSGMRGHHKMVETEPGKVEVIIVDAADSQIVHHVPMTRDQYDRWLANKEPVQVIFPQMAIPVREILISGFGPVSYDAICDSLAELEEEEEEGLDTAGMSAEDLERAFGPHWGKYRH